MGRIGIVLLVAVSAAAAACGEGDVGSAANAGGGDSAMVDGRTFISQSVHGYDLVDGTEVRLSFRDGSVGASAGCNSLGGAYSSPDDTLAMSPNSLSMTEIGCDPDRHAQDDWLAGFLMASPTMMLDGDVLILATADATIRLLDRRTAEPDLPLVGTVWQVDTVLDGDAAGSVPPTAPVTIELADDGTFLATSAGCTSAAGSFDVGGATLTFGDFGLDHIGCPPPWSSVVDVLRAGKVGYSIEADRLTLTVGRIGVSATAVD